MINKKIVKILVIEDEAGIRENIQEILKFEDFEVFVAENGKVGTQILKQELPDLVICDIMMPEMDGYHVLQELQQDPITTNIPLIFLTAKADRSDLRRGIELGADDYLTKPFTPEELINAIAIRLQKRSNASEYYQRVNQKDRDYLINHDHLTGLPNQKFVEQIFSISPEPLTALIFFSLDQFKRVNEAIGHTFSDSLLQAIAQRLKEQLLNREEIQTLARLQADNFILLIKAIDQRQVAIDIAQSILQILSQPFLLSGHHLSITASVGLAFCPQDSENISELIGQSEIAMAYVKQQGGNAYHCYTKDLNIESSNWLYLENALHYALDRQEFEIYYQPQVDLNTGKIYSAEALLRWHNPEAGLISPDKFIPIAEETGLIIPIGEWVLRSACKQLKSWQKTHSDLKIAVNLSAHQFKQPHLCEKIIAILAETGLEPKYLEIEITEGTLIRDIKAASATLKTLVEMGIQVSIDDFGIGYSSLSYLQKLPFSTIKIDRCFVCDIDQNQSNAAITQAIINMAHDMNLLIIAEGVEREEELAVLRKMHCDAIQGYLFSRPLPAQGFEQLILADKQLDLVTDVTWNPHPPAPSPIKGEGE